MKSRILVVDDDAEFNALLTAILRNTGHPVDSFLDPSVAVRRLPALTDLGLVVMDNSMPAMNGLEFSARVREVHPQVPQLLVTGTADGPTIREFIRRKIHGIFLKPINVLSFKRKALQLLGEKAVAPLESPALDNALYQGLHPRTAEFKEALAKARSFRATLVVVGHPGTDFPRVVWEMSGRTDRLQMMPAAQFSSETVLRRWAEAGAGGLFTLAILEAMDLTEAQAAELRQMRQQSQGQMRFIFCLPQPPDDLLESGAIGNDLYMLLGMNDLVVPPLADVPEEAAPLAQAYLDEAEGLPLRLDPATLALISRHPWPGNHRQLQAVMLACRRLTPGSVITAPVFQRALGEVSPTEVTAAPPVIEPAPRAGEEVSAGETAAPVARRVLLLDDEPVFIRLIANFLRKNQFVVESVTSPFEALDLVRAQRFEVLISDFRMPEMDGAEFLREVRKIQPGLPAIVVSGGMNLAELADSANLGIELAMEKPISLPVLLESMHTILAARANPTKPAK